MVTPALVDIVLTLLWGLIRLGAIVAGFAAIVWLATRPKEAPYYIAGCAVLLGYLIHGLRWWLKAHS